MSGSALAFMVIAWGVIITAVVVTLSSLLKHSNK